MKKGSKATQEQREKISANHADVGGVKNPMFGKKRPDLSLRNKTNNPMHNESSKMKAAKKHKGVRPPNYIDGKSRLRHSAKRRGMHVLVVWNRWFPKSHLHHINNTECVYIDSKIHYSCNHPNQETHRQKVMAIYRTLDNMIAGRTYGN